MSDHELPVLHGQSIALVSTVPFFVMNQLYTHIRNLRRLGMHVTVVTSPGHELEAFSDDPGIAVVMFDIPRRIRPWKDLQAVFRLFSLFRREAFSIVHSTTPKAGLLCAIAARLARVPVRLHTFTGQVWVTRKGIMRAVLRASDRIMALLNTHCYALSASQYAFIIDAGIADAEHLSTYAYGSQSGVDLARFSPERFSQEEKEALGRTLGLEKHALVLTYIGRITRDKGVHELLSAFQRLKERYPDIALLMLGPLDDGSGESIRNMFASVTGVHWLGHVADPERYLAMTDVLCLPSYREGFGTVVIEAAAMGVPTVGSDIPGLVDAVENGKTGILVPPRDTDALIGALETLVRDREALQSMKDAARERCLSQFDARIVNQAMAAEYAKWLAWTEQRT